MAYVIQRNTEIGHILGVDGEFHHPKMVGPNQQKPRTWKTRRGAEAYAADRWNAGQNQIVKVAEVR